MADSQGRGRLPGARSRPLFRRRERTRCRSLLFFLPVFTRPRAPRHATRTLHTPVETVSPPCQLLDGLQYSGLLGKRGAMTSAGVGVAVNSDGFTAAGLAAHRARTAAGAENVELAVVFAGTRHDDDEYSGVLSAVRRTLPSAIILGCS